MSVSKRARYEVLRRDNHTCRYCGGRAPDVQLTVDHVTPTALGGSDDPSNLVAACRDCNAGKAATRPDDDLVANVSDDALRWAAAMQRAADRWLTARKGGWEYGDVVAHEWDSDNDAYRRGYAFLPDDWTDTVEVWRRLGIPAEMVADAVGVAMRKRLIKNSDIWRYTCGIVWKQYRELQSEAAASLQPAEADDPAQFDWDAFGEGYRTAWRDHVATWEHFQLSALSEVVDGIPAGI
jgi:hypothetical protein